MKENEVFDCKRYIERAIRIIKSQEDAEDAIQNAFIDYLEKKETDYKNDNPELIIQLLVDRECVKLNQKRHREKMEEFDTFTPRRKRLVDASNLSFNEGSQNYDMRVLRGSRVALKQYFGIYGRTT